MLSEKKVPDSISDQHHEQKYNAYDIIVVGTGAAGLFTAINLPSKFKVLMITKDTIENSDSYLAQGGISALLDEDDYKSYFSDTMTAGKNENNKNAVEIMIRESKQIIEDLCSYGVEFDRDKDGNISYTREGAHSAFRILHHKDETGKEITSKLIREAKSRKNIHIKEFETLIDLLVYHDKCTGILVKDKIGNIKTYLCNATILATGGLGGLFQNTTNFKHITGDSFAIAYNNNIEIENINYIQIHPTALYSQEPGRKFLISESVRGEGAVLLNEKKERFVNELLPRDIVTEAIWNEMNKTNSKFVYLSLKHMDKEEIIYRFPNIYQKCLEQGYDLSTDLIPVTPAQHYLMGGIKATTDGKSSKEGLYVVGETACNGVHGANRLASNSLLESLVFAKRTAKTVGAELKGKKSRYYDVLNENNEILTDRIYNLEKLQKEYRRIILNEIKRKDEKFYVKWCNNENQY